LSAAAPRARFVEDPGRPAFVAALPEIARGGGGAVLALVAEASRDAVGALQAACRAEDVVVLGAVFPALVHDGAFAREGAWLVRLEEVPRHALVEGIGGTAREGARRIARALAPLPDGESPLLVVLFDALVPDVATIVDELYLELADAVRYVGARAGSETFTSIPCVFDGERCVAGGALAMLLPAPARAALEHGYAAPDDAVAATSTAGNRVASIDWRPAFDVYRERVRARFGVELDRESFYRWAVHYPFGIVLANGATVVRIPSALGEDGSVMCVGEVPEGALLVVLDAPAPGTTATVEQLRERLAPEADALPLVFYCAGRRMHLGDAAVAELATLGAELGAPPAGALSLGEIGAASGGFYPLFHNAALIGLSLPGR
jgi:hypothetical protein